MFVLFAFAHWRSQLIQSGNIFNLVMNENSLPGCSFCCLRLESCLEQYCLIPFLLTLFISSPTVSLFSQFMWPLMIVNRFSFFKKFLYIDLLIGWLPLKYWRDAGTPPHRPTEAVKSVLTSMRVPIFWRLEVHYVHVCLKLHPCIIIRRNL